MRWSRWWVRPAVGSTPGSGSSTVRWSRAFNGRTVAVGAYFGVDVDSIVVRLLGEQLADGTSHVGPGRHEFTFRFRPAEQDRPIPVYDPFAEFADA